MVKLHQLGEGPKGKNIIGLNMSINRVTLTFVTQLYYIHN
jgi:hypothetical protein